jgi:hypothetical protein
MPNGGVPHSMRLFPQLSKDKVVFVSGTKFSVFDKADFDTNDTNATPILELTASEAQGIAWFLKYWFAYPGNSDTLRPPYDLNDIDVQF